jgi:cytidylate kinase
MYRAVSYVGLSRGLDIADELEMTRLAEDITMRLTSSRNDDRLLVDGQDITDHLRKPEVERGVSTVAAISGVRLALVRQQRAIAADGPIVMVGRDIGTVVLQDATVKAYLNASVEVRAKRRYDERKDSPGSLSYAAVLEDLIRRDTMDSERADSPLRPADDAVIIDTDGLAIGEVARRIVDLVDSI